MKALLFAAGLGTRLRPITENLPKALVPIKGVPLLERNIQWLIGYGYDEIIINIHYLGEQIADFLAKKNNFGIKIALSDEREKLLDTGGGMKKAAWFLKDNTPDEPFVVLNADILTDLDLHDMRRRFDEQAPLALLAVQRRASSRYLLFDQNGQLRAWQNIKTGEQKMVDSQTTIDKQAFTPMAFSGLQLVSPAIFEKMPPNEVFSLIDLYLAAASNQLIRAYPHNDTRWIDVGNPQSIQQAEVLF